MSDNGIVNAAEEQNFQEVKRLVEGGADVNERNSYNSTALHFAAQYGPLEIVQYLVEHNADINGKNWRNETALHYAVKSGSREVVIYLVEHGASVNDINTSDRTNLHFAVECNSLEMVKYLVEHGAKVTREGCRACDTVLYCACRLGNEQIVDYLLQHQAIKDINKKKWASPLKVACSGGHTRVVETLLKYGVDIRQERTLPCRNDEIFAILKQEINKSIKHRDKIHKLKNLDEEKLTKVRHFLLTLRNS
jgi:serine/threonine-protein phosphatase 6 regulatory ankyrin repeat subunit B